MNRRGFTLLELLVVVAIIGLLSSITLAVLSSARSKGRDTQRQRDLTSIRSALELYYIDNSSYPSTSNNWYGVCSNFSSKGVTGSGGYVPNLAPTYMAVLPVDPKPIGTANCYLYRSNGTDYMVLVYGTVENTIPDSLKRPNYPTERDFAIYTTGATSW